MPTPFVLAKSQTVLFFTFKRLQYACHSGTQARPCLTNPQPIFVFVWPLMHLTRKNRARAFCLSLSLSLSLPLSLLIIVSV